MFVIKNGNLFYSYLHPCAWSASLKEAALFSEEQAQSILDHWQKMKTLGDKRVAEELKKGAKPENIPACDVFICGVIANNSIMVEL